VCGTLHCSGADPDAPQKKSPCDPKNTCTSVAQGTEQHSLGNICILCCSQRAIRGSSVRPTTAGPARQSPCHKEVPGLGSSRTPALQSRPCCRHAPVHLGRAVVSQDAPSPLDESVRPTVSITRNRDPLRWCHTPSEVQEGQHPLIVPAPPCRLHCIAPPEGAILSPIRYQQKGCLPGPDCCR
jgi:hypothetical protein